ncbi:MAG TPA: DUF3093 domain-containing protein [Nocardioidaceae bacterium]|nr:DUF3093 domain-containing protein [Nocardioidaceae bacterium]
MSPDTDVQYDERLRVPLRWWVQATMFLASIWLAFVVALPAAVAWGATAVLTLATVALFLGYGAVRVRVVAGELWAGRAHIPVTWLSSPEPLDAERTRLLAGRNADARAYHLLRPYVKRSLRVDVDDPADPAPYWLVSTRRPDALAEALSAAKAGRAQA